MPPRQTALQCRHNKPLRVSTRCVEPPSTEFQSNFPSLTLYLSWSPRRDSALPHHHQGRARCPQHFRRVSYESIASLVPFGHILCYHPVLINCKDLGLNHKRHLRTIYCSISLNNCEDTRFRLYPLPRDAFNTSACYIFPMFTSSFFSPTLYPIHLFLDTRIIPSFEDFRVHKLHANPS